GDYEGIAVVDSTAYVLKSDGDLFEIVNYLRKDFEVKTHDTPFSGKNNMESLTFDKENNRLLLVTKDKDLESSDYLGIYAFNLVSKELETNPLIKINKSDPIFKNNTKKKKDDKKES